MMREEEKEFQMWDEQISKGFSHPVVFVFGLLLKRI